jgi:hypothetical protein
MPHQSAAMIVYKDMVSGDEMISEAFPVRLPGAGPKVPGLMEAKSSLVPVGGGCVGGGGEDEEDMMEDVETENDIIAAFGYTVRCFPAHGAMRGGA